MFLLNATIIVATKIMEALQKNISAEIASPVTRQDKKKE